MSERVWQRMSPLVVSIGPLAKVADAERLAGEQAVRHLVVAQHGDVVGVLCTCDLHEASPEERVSMVMSRPALTVAPDASLESAAETMREFGVGCLPVVSKGSLVGIISRSDIRRSGSALADRRRCHACGSGRHVRRSTDRGGVSFCLDCLERGTKSEDTDELGGED